MLYLEPPAKSVPKGILPKLRRPHARQVNAGLTWELPAGRTAFAVHVGDKVVGEFNVEVKR
jgi:hypothetical protein